MPALQALAGIPSFGGQLGQALGGGISQGISSSINQMLQQKQQRQTGSALAQYLGKPEMANVLGSLPSDIQKELAKSHFKQQQQNVMDNQITQGSFDRMAELSDKIGLSFLPAGAHTEESAGNRAEFESQKASLVAALRDKVNKGVLTNQKFEFIKNELLPSHGDRTVVKKRKLKAIGEQLGLDTSALKLDEKKEINLKKVPGGTKLEPHVAEQIFEKSGNDPNKARKLAQKLGYEW